MVLTPIRRAQAIGSESQDSKRLMLRLAEASILCYDFSNMTNKEIAQTLRNVAAAYVIKNESKFRFQIIAYQKAADAIDNSTIELKDLAKQGSLEDLSGVGPSIKAHLEELLNTGKVKHFDWVFSGIPQSTFLLLDIPSFGPKRAYKLVEHFKLTNPKTAINDLYEIAKRGKIADLSGFGEKSQADILRAINEYKEGKSKETRMTLPYALEIAAKIVLHLKECKHATSVEPLGSLRRMVPTIGDIDIAVATKFPKEVIEHFVSYPHKERVIEKGDSTASILLSGNHQVDLMIQPQDSFGSLLQHFTGSKAHNIHLREYALKKNLSLSEYGIKKKTKGGKWKLENFKTEKEFYHALGLDWIPPEIRENNGEIELAISHRLPDLIEEKDILGDLHIHSNYPIEPSHDLGKNSIEEILQKAVERNYEYIGLSEHNPSVSKHTKDQIHKLLIERDEAIEHIKSGNKNVRIIKMLEVDILPNGDLSIDNKSLDILDAVIVSVHSSFSQPRELMTERVLKALSHPKAKILGHPTGRLLNERRGFELEWEKIFEFCLKNNKALEINSWPARLDLPEQIVKNAVSQNVKMIINTDSHAKEHMDMIKYGISVARRGWAQKKDILNTLHYEDFTNWLKK